MNEEGLIFFPKAFIHSLVRVPAHKLYIVVVLGEQTVIN